MQRRRRGGFRLRLLGLATSMLAVAILVALVAQRALLLEQHDSQVEETLEQERQELENLAGGVDPGTGEPFGGDVEAIFRVFMDRNVPVRDEMYLALVDGRPFLATRDAPVDLLAQEAFIERVARLESGERGDLETPEGPVRYMAVPLADSAGEARGVFVIAQLLTAEREQIDDNTRSAMLVAAAILLVTTFAAWMLAGRLLRPIRELTETATRISDTDLGERIPVRGDDEISELARTFNEMLERLAAGFDNQRAFIDDAGHELRTPITVIRGQLEVMGDDPDERREVMAIVDTELDRMSRIVEDLLVLAKSEQPDFVRREVVELSDLLTEVFVKSKSLGERNWRLDSTTAGPVHVDPQRLTQAMLNLARNAVEHAPADATIALGAALADGTLEMWVRDSGPPIAPEDRERIFERFSRAGRRRADGAGLGLSIVRAIAKGHDGRAELRVDDTGNRFVVVVPSVSVPDPGMTDQPPDDDHDRAHAGIPEGTAAAAGGGTEGDGGMTA